MMQKIHNHNGTNEITLPKEFCNKHNIKTGDTICFKIHRIIKHSDNGDEIEEITQLLELK